MSKLLKTIHLDTSELQEIENYLHRTEMVLSGKVNDKKIEEIQNTYLQIHDGRISLETKVKEANLGNQSLQIGVVGSFSTGKSSFLNSLIGEDLLGTDLMPTTAKITKLIHGEKLRILKVLKDGQISEITLLEYKEYSIHNKNKNQVSNDLSEIEYFKIEYPSSFLEKFTLIDTPGFSSTSKEDDELTMSMVPELDVLLWLFDVNKTGDADEMKLIKALGKNIKIYAIINKVDLKAPNAREKIFQDLSSRYSFEKVFLYSSKEIFERTYGQKKIKERWFTLLDEFLANGNSEFEDILIKFKGPELSIGEDIYSKKHLNKNEFEKYHTLLIHQLDKLRQEYRLIFEAIYGNELADLVQNGNKITEHLVTYQKKLLEEYESKLEILDKNQDELISTLNEILESVFEVYFGKEFYNSLFSKFFDFYTEKGWFSNSDSLKIKNIEIEAFEKELIERFDIYLNKFLAKYSNYLEKLPIKTKSLLLSEQSRTLENLKKLCYSILKQASITIILSAEKVYSYDVSNRDAVKEGVIKDFFYVSPLELVFDVVHNTVFDDLGYIYSTQLDQYEKTINELIENIQFQSNTE